MFCCTYRAQIMQKFMLSNSYFYFLDLVSFIGLSFLVEKTFCWLKLLMLLMFVLLLMDVNVIECSARCACKHSSALLQK